MNACELFKALADSSRLQILALLMEKPHCVEDLATKTSLAISTVSAHLKKLQAADLVYVRKHQYYSIYHLKKEKLDMTINELLGSERQPQTDKTETLRKKVLETYFREGRIVQLPTQNKKRWIVYQEIIKLFNEGISYTEKEINELIKSVYDDYCIIRRELVDEGVLHRENGIYRLIPNYQENPGFYQKIWMMSQQ